MVDFERDFHQPPKFGAEQSPKINVKFAEEEKHKVEIVLNFPLIMAEELIEKIIIHRPTSKQVMDLVESLPENTSDSDLFRAIIAGMAKVPSQVIEALEADDAGRVASAALPFMPASLSGNFIKNLLPEPMKAAPQPAA